MSQKDFNYEVQRAVQLANEGRVVESRNLLETLSNNDRKNTDILMLLAQINTKTGEFKRAEQNYKKIIQLTPGNISVHTNLGMLYHSKGLFQKAEKSYKQSLKLNSKQPVVNFNLGAVLQEQGKLEEAQQKYLIAINLDPTYAKAYANLGYILRQLNKLDASIDNYRKALEHAPDVPEIFYNLGISLLQNGIPEEAEYCQRKALELRANYSDAWRDLGAAQLYREDLEAAIASFKKAIASDPKSVDALCGLAKSLSMMGALDQAKDQIEKALLIDPGHLEARYIQGKNLIALGKLEEALENCEYILKKSPEDKSALSLAASIYEKKGQPEKAYMYLEPLLLEPHSNIEAVLSFASISKAIDRINDAVRMLEDVLENNAQLPVNNRRHLHFALGKIYDGLHNYEAAFNNYELGNQLKQVDFDISSFESMVDASIKVFSKEFLTKYALKTPSVQPVFIVGMPRSGTSLVEQIISSHPQVFGAGELDNINEITANMAMTLGSDKAYPECITDAESDDLRMFSKSYIEYLNDLDHDALRITDKMPTNFLRIGLIRTLFPKAHIIHCIRDPLDTCLSCYFQDFGGNHPWIYDLENLALVYKEYLRIMHYWQYELEVPIYNVRYEELVENQEIISKELINYIGLEWDEHCIQFHENKRFIWTASYDQVRQPMYKQSISRWKNYEKQLSKLIDTLDVNAYRQ